VRIKEQSRIVLSLILAPVGEGDDILNAELSWPRSNEVWLCISRGDPQVVTGKSPMAVALRACDYCKIWGWLRLKLLSEGILHFQVVIGGSASLYSAQATLTVNRKGVGTLGLVEVSAVALAIAWPRYVLAAVTLVPRANAAE